MLIWVPVEERREKESKIAKVMEAKAWALINFDARDYSIHRVL